MADRILSLRFIAPDILWKLAQEDLSALYDVCSAEHRAALAREQQAKAVE